MGVKQGTRSQWNRWIILSPVFVFGPISFTIYKNTNYAKRCLLRKGFCFPFYEITRSQISLSEFTTHVCKNVNQSTQIQLYRKCWEKMAHYWESCPFYMTPSVFSINLTKPRNTKHTDHIKYQITRDPPEKEIFYFLGIS